ncbi:MAG: radical SAM protein [Bacteroidales bacterium]|nr:radical SAM protein [Bacteroidales bacterium]
MKGYQNDSNLIRWEITRKCNFQCDYCGITYDNDKKKIQSPIDISKLAESLNFLKGNWRFDITGGEPLIEGNIIDICREITKTQHISLNTNLSNDKVFDFADIIDPTRCSYILTSVHIAEREKREKNLNIFIKKILYLQEKGFVVTAFYVAHPVLFERIKSDIELLKSSGVYNVRIQIFRGNFNKKNYPNSFTSEQKAFLETMDANYPEFEILNNSQFNFRGRLCLAGKKYFVMDRNGNLRRCLNYNKSYGNFFDKTFRFDKNPLPCPKSEYICPHECIEFGLDKKGGRLSILKEIFVNKYMC